MTQTSAGTPTMRPSAVSPTGYWRPVCSCCRLAQMWNAIVRDDAGNERRRDEPGVALQHRLRHEEAALVEEEKIAGVQRLARAGQRGQHRDVPEQQLQQERQVADHLDIDHRHLGDDPVLRQPRDADDKAEDRGEEDADRRDDEGVEEADQERVAIGRGRGAVGDEGLVDVEAGGRREEAEARGDARRPKVRDRVGGGRVDEKHDDDGEDDLIDDRPQLRIVEERRPRGRLFGLSDRRHWPVPVGGFLSLAQPSLSRKRRAAKRAFASNPMKRAPGSLRTPVHPRRNPFSGSAARIAGRPSSRAHSGRAGS